MVSKWHYALGLGETEGMGVGAVVTSVITSPTVMTVPSCGAVPNRVLGLDLFAEVALMGEWEGSGRMAGRHVVVVVLWHGVPL